MQHTTTPLSQNPLRTLLAIVTLTFGLMLAWSPVAIAADPQTTTGQTHVQDARDAHGFPMMDLEGLESFETTHLKAWAVPQAAVAMEKLVGNKGEQVRARIYSDLGLEEEAPIRVLFLPDLNDYFRRRNMKPRAPHWAVGLAIPSESTILVKWGRTEAGPWVALEPTFIHEMAHMALDRAVDAKGIHIDGAIEKHTSPTAKHQRIIPRWLHEGFAIAQAGEWSLERSTVLMQAGLRGRIIPLPDLHQGFPADGFDVELAYAQSYHFVLHLREQYGQRALAPLIKHMSEGHDFEAAFAKAYGRSFRIEERAWRDHLNVAYTWIPIITGSSTIWFLGGIIFVLAWRRRRKERKERLEAMEVMENLTQAAARRAVPLPGMGLTVEHVRARSTEERRDGTALTPQEWHSSPVWRLPPTSDLPEELDIPRTDDGHTIH